MSEFNSGNDGPIKYDTLNFFVVDQQLKQHVHMCAHTLKRNFLKNRRMQIVRDQWHFLP